ncbi:aminotransferase class IV [Leucobacter viscericola]|uniref:Aminotransferase class IV n=1 Tax=Leucobacter viscericola TaxID=2714935 RepID=A0A6G7XCL2_9MICO|nr:aminotransferase class IV [Leucobacter viscericola]QIK62108.1 aminotransferase class IV [Leucobacter viscericola]
MNGAPRALLVADSFRVRVNATTGRAEVRGWRRHLDRFRRGVEDATPELEQPVVEGFLSEASHAIRDYGEGFPRLELWHEPNRAPELSFTLRPLPQLQTELELATAPGVTLEHAARKGPNIARLTEINHRLGAEALLVDRAGRVLEGATTSLVWWDSATRAGHVVQDRASRVSSVTESLLLNETSLTPGRIPPGNLTAHEVWAVNALHGIRVVTAIDGFPTQEPNSTRLERFREALDRYWEPVSA